jgi:hypothetical protein
MQVIEWVFPTFVHFCWIYVAHDDIKQTINENKPPIWDPDLGPWFGTPIWDPDLGPRFGTLI